MASCLHFRWSKIEGLSMKWNKGYHNQRSKHLNFHYIYRISYRNAKKANLANGFALLKNDITRLLNALIFTCSLQMYDIGNRPA